MTPLRNVVVLFVITLLCATSVFAGGFQLNEHGARAVAQGGAFAARATDGSAVYFNPGGLGFQTSASIYAGATAIVPAFSFFGPTELNSNQETKMTDQVFTPINVYGVYPVMDKLTVALGVYNAYGLGTQWPDTWPGKALNQKIDLKTFFFTPTVAYRLLDNLSVGVGVNYVTGSVLLKKAANFDTQTTLDMTADGWGFNVGVAYHPLPDVSVGVSYRSSVKVSANGSATFVPNLSVLPTGDVSTSITLPATGYAGVAYKVNENLSVEADYQYVGWSSYDKLVFTFAKNGATSTQPKNYKDTFIARVGGEYNLNGIKLRAGYYYDHSPVDDAYVDPLLPDMNRHGFSVGLGYPLTENLSVDASYLFIKFIDRTVTNSIPETSFDGTYKAYANLFSLNVGYSF